MPHQQLVTIPAGRQELRALLGFPENFSAEAPSGVDHGVVLFAHGTGSGRFSPRNQYVASELRSMGIITVLVDLLTDEEAQEREMRFNIPLLAERLVAVQEWAACNPVTSRLRLGIFGSSTGAAAAFVAAAKLGHRVAAVVSRGGRPDLAEDFLHQVRCPSLLIVGENDRTVLELNRAAFEDLRTVKELIVIPRATHLFEEPGALPLVARRASEWFLKYLTPQQPRGEYQPQAA